MTKRIPWINILEVIGRFPEGASLEEVMLALDPSISRRTVQRWLALLTTNKDLIVIGKARARRFKLCRVYQKEIVNQPILPITEIAASIQEKVSQPIQARGPVTYNRNFLENYRPNETYYLSEDLRNKLLAMGSTEEDGNYPAGTYARQIFSRLLIDLSWNSSRLEGNTYSLLETERLLEWGNAASGKDIKETQMILNHKNAIEFLINSASEIGANRYTILNLHTLLSDNLYPNNLKSWFWTEAKALAVGAITASPVLEIQASCDRPTTKLSLGRKSNFSSCLGIMSDPAACGRLRTFSIGISHSVYLPIAIPQVIQECFDLLIEKANAIKDPFEQALFLMVQIPYLQAFDDVNKRTSRLAANIPLIQNNLCPLSFIDVPEKIYINGLLGIYELNRVELLRDVFVWAYERSCSLYSTTRKAIGEPDPFRMQYRNMIKQIMEHIVCSVMNKTEAIKAIREHAVKLIPQQDRLRFIETVERELISLHEGNIARYQLRPIEYENWKKSWQ